MAINIHDYFTKSRSSAIISTYIYHTVSDRTVSSHIISILEKVDITIAVVLVACHYYEKVDSKKKHIKSGHNQIIYSPSIYKSYRDTALNEACDDKLITFLSLLIVSYKYIYDIVYTNKWWSQISGVDLTELNRYEQHVFFSLDYRFRINKDIMVDIERSLRNKFRNVRFERKEERRGIICRFFGCTLF